MNDSYLPFQIDGIVYVVPIEYVFSVLPASEGVPSCMPPGRPAYVERVILAEKNLVPVIEWSRVAQVGLQNRTLQRALLVILRYKNRMLGVLVDHVTAPFTLTEPRLELDVTKTHTLVLFEETHYILFDLPKFFQNRGDTK